MGNIVKMLRNSKVGRPTVYPVVEPEFSQLARTSSAHGASPAVLFDQSHHMAETSRRRPGCGEVPLLTSPSTPSRTSTPGKAKHFVPVHPPEGYVIGDGLIMFRESETEFNLVGRAPTVSWVQYHAETGNWDVKLTEDPRSPSRPQGKPVLRRPLTAIQVQGPKRPRQYLEEKR